MPRDQPEQAERAGLWLYAVTRSFSGDTLDVSLQFAHGATSSHPVMRDAGSLARPSLLKAMWDIGSAVQGRAISLRILCTDCHNNDNARAFGGTGPNGPHGSKNDHILERRYLISQIGPGASPGSMIVNLNPKPILDSSPAAPYALCAKCHDLNYINSGASWTGHTVHIQMGFSCSVCHSAHGVPAGTSSVSGSALVSFDMNVVGNNMNLPVSYNSSTCTLTCHQEAHLNRQASVTGNKSATGEASIAKNLAAAMRIPERIRSNGLIRTAELLRRSMGGEKLRQSRGAARRFAGLQRFAFSWLSVSDIGPAAASSKCRQTPGGKARCRACPRRGDHARPDEAGGR